LAETPLAERLTGPESRRNDGDGFRLGGANIDAAAEGRGRRGTGCPTARAERSDTLFVRGNDF
jgi:hypothetical protein